MSGISVNLGIYSGVVWKSKTFYLSSSKIYIISRYIILISVLSICLLHLFWRLGRSTPCCTLPVAWCAFAMKSTLWFHGYVWWFFLNTFYICIGLILSINDLGLELIGWRLSFPWPKSPNITSETVHTASLASNQVYNLLNMDDLKMKYIDEWEMKYHERWLLLLSMLLVRRSLNLWRILMFDW